MTIRFANIASWLSYWLSHPRLEPGDQQVLEGYYRSYMANFGPYLQAHYASQIREMEEIVAQQPGCRILEIGCGCGTESLWLSMLGASVVGIDLDRSRLAVARARLAHTTEILGYCTKTRFEELSVFRASELGPFDAVWMEQAFHHIEPRAQFLELLRLLVRPGGTLVISEANAWNPLLQIQLFRRRGFKTLRVYQDSFGQAHPYGNERITSSRQLTRQLIRVGFQVRSVRHFRVLPNAAWSDRLRGIESVVPSWFRPAFTNFNLVAEHAPSTVPRSTRSASV